MSPYCSFPDEAFLFIFIYAKQNYMQQQTTLQRMLCEYEL